MIETAIAQVDAPRATRCGDAEAFRRALARMAVRHGFAAGVYVHLGHRWQAATTAPAPRRLISTGVGDEDYYRDNFAVLDPLASRAARSFTPFAWNLGELRLSFPASARFLQGMEVRGMRSGVVAPVQDHAAGPAFVNLFHARPAASLGGGPDGGPGGGPGGAGAVARPDDEHESASGALLLAAAQLHAIGKRMAASGPEPRACAGLSEREMDVLRLAALGHGEQETARMLALSRRGVQFHLNRAAQKLGAPNKTAAVARAASAGLIHV